ncbi:MAG: hypothetical protein J07HX64_02869 [halophilic archaeon J07HX64]|nr:MAG: hypothetical protein J07HX64_02869 [halophilic archaeon J07HX64]
MTDNTDELSRLTDPMVLPGLSSGLFCLAVATDGELALVLRGAGVILFGVWLFSFAWNELI